MDTGVQSAGHVRQLPSETPAKRKAPIACKNCNLRKVRCNVAVSKPPCANCLADRVECEILPRKKRLSRKIPFSRNAQGSRQSQRAGGAGSAELHRSVFSCGDSGSQSSPANYQQPITISENHLSNEEQNNFTTRCNSGPDEGEHVNAFAAALDPSTTTEENGSLFYSGDKHGAIAFLNDLMAPGENHQEIYYLVPRGTRKSKRPEDLAFLRIKGAFSIPSKEVCDELICAFFHHVYPLLPIIDARHFLEQYLSRGCQNVNLLLLWSMFLAAANFVEPEVLQMSGYKTRKAMKRAMYQRAKSLYDSAYEDDRISLIQSVILLGFWYTDAEDRFEAWHWIGIAISLSQTLGLHRSPELVNASQRLPPSGQGLFRRIWWSCFVRDRWLSLVKGRPMRINLDDCDVRFPSADDIALELEEISPMIRLRYIPYEPKVVGQLWYKLIEISKALGNVLKTYSRMRMPKAEVEDIQRCQRELSACAFDDEAGEQSHPHMQLFACQLRLFHQASIIVLYRPYVLKGPSDLPAQEQASWQEQALRKAKDAASDTNYILEDVMSLDLVKYMKPMTITTLIPAMQIHLLDCKSPSSSIRRLGNHKLQLCMMVLSELRETYWGADFTWKMFERAQSKLAEDGQHNSAGIIGANNQISAPPYALIPRTPDSSTLSQAHNVTDMPSIDDILAPEFALGEPYQLWSGDLGSNQDIGQDFSLNSFLNPEEFNGFMGIDSIQM